MTDQDRITLELTREQAEVETCKRCGGIGDEMLHSFAGSGEYFWRPCPACDGEGEVPTLNAIAAQLKAQGEGE